MPAWDNPFTYGAPQHTPAAPAVTREQELAALKAQAEYLEDALDGVRRQLKDLEAQGMAPQAG